MNKKLILYIIAFFLFDAQPFPPSVFAGGVANNNPPDKKIENDWYPFFLSEKMHLDAPMNIGKIVLDPPAGKHGFVHVRDDQFHFENGTIAKFWGTTLGKAACFPSKRQAEILADNLAFFGFNLVRLHPLDKRFAPQSIFADVAPAHKDPQAKHSGSLDKDQLDRLDYLIYQLSLRGIYVNINLLVSRVFTEADGVVDAASLNSYKNPVFMFDRKLIELQKAYNNKLLTHYNPYTQKRLCDDPTVALIEISNEDSIIKDWKHNKLDKNILTFKKDIIPDYYIKQLDHLWNTWLKLKYIAPNNTVYSWSSKNNLSTNTNKDPENNTTKFNFSRPAYKILKSLPPMKRQDVTDFYIELETKYINEMKHFLTSECDIKIPITGISGFPIPENAIAQQSCDFLDIHAYWDPPQFPNTPWDIEDFRIHNKSMLLDNELGIIGKIEKKQQEIAQLIGQTKKPITINEWNHCYPNVYAYETPILIALEAKNKNWDGVTQFSFDSKRGNKHRDHVQSYFQINANPQQLILNSVGSLLFNHPGEIKSSLKNGVLRIDSVPLSGIVGFIEDTKWRFNDFSIMTKDNGNVFLYAIDKKPLKETTRLLLITIGTIKNTDSGWTNQGKYKWGHAPTLLKHMDVTVEIPAHKSLIVFELDNAGRRAKEVKVLRAATSSSFTTREATSPFFEILIKSNLPGRLGTE